MPDFKKQLATFVQMLRNIEDEFKLSQAEITESIERALECEKKNL